jgi:hypothetical protein
MEVTCSSETPVDFKRTTRFISHKIHNHFREGLTNYNTVREYYRHDRPCGLVVRVLGYRSGGPGSIPGSTRKKK